MASNPELWRLMMPMVSPGFPSTMTMTTSNLSNRFFCIHLRSLLATLRFSVFLPGCEILTIDFRSTYHRIISVFRHMGTCAFCSQAAPLPEEARGCHIKTCLPTIVQLVSWTQVSRWRPITISIMIVSSNWKPSTCFHCWRTLLACLGCGSELLMHRICPHFPVCLRLC